MPSVPKPRLTLARLDLPENFICFLADCPHSRLARSFRGDQTVGCCFCAAVRREKPHQATCWQRTLRSRSPPLQPVPSVMCCGAALQWLHIYRAYHVQNGPCLGSNPIVFVAAVAQPVHFSPRPVLQGVSAGGLMAHSWPRPWWGRCLHTALPLSVPCPGLPAAAPSPPALLYGPPTAAA